MKQDNQKTTNELREIIKNHHGGTILLMTVLILASILTVTLTVGEIVRTGLIMGRTQVHSTKAFFAAETGIEQVLWETRINGFNTGGCDSVVNKNVNFDPPPPASCDNLDHDYLLSNQASYRVIYISGPPAETDTTFHSYGSYENMQRRVEIYY
jgi:hypothetical protein